MTTIVYRDGILAADRRAYSGGTVFIGYKTKIRRLKSGGLVGISTNQVGLTDAIVKYFDVGGDKPTMKEQDFTVLIIRANSEVFYASDEFHLSGPLDASFFAIGSGKQFAYGALEMGATAMEAVRVAAVHDIWSGFDGSPDTLHLNEGDECQITMEL